MTSTPRFPHHAPGGTVSHDDLVAALEAGAWDVIDVREPHEFAAGRIPGSRNLPLSRFHPSALPTEKPVVLVCHAGGRSMAAMRAALGAGVAHVAHYPPGASGWRLRGGKLEF